LILECIDPEGKVQKKLKTLPKLANVNMKKWRKHAREFIDQSPEPHKPLTLHDFVDHWGGRVPYESKKTRENKDIGEGKDKKPLLWPESAPLIDLAYKLIVWIENFQENPEGLVYLEAITQTIIQTGFLNDYEAKIFFDKEGKLEFESIKEAIWNIFVPIATGGVSIDEKLLEALPENRINIMSIHQSKGLEFPLVIVDVGSRFKKNNVKTSFLRFPKEGGGSSLMEDQIRPYSPLGKAERTPKDRAFDDLTRLYFVAFSRAQDVLLLVGLESALMGYMVNEDKKEIPNIALGWRRDKEFIGFDEILLI